MASTMQDAFGKIESVCMRFENTSTGELQPIAQHPDYDASDTSLLAPVPFPFRCVLDRVLVEEIPLDESKIVTPGMELHRSERFIKRSDRARVLAVGQGVPMGSVIMPMPYKAGDVIVCSEFGRDPFYLHPEDEFDKSIPRRYLIRVADTKGCIL